MFKDYVEQYENRCLDYDIWLETAYFDSSPVTKSDINRPIVRNMAAITAKTDLKGGQNHAITTIKP